MAAVHLAELERVAVLARSIVSPLADLWSRGAGVTVRIDAPEAEPTSAADLAASLQGDYWILPIDVTGVHNGVVCVLVSKRLSAAAGPGRQFASLVDAFLASAGDRLTAALGGPVSLDRRGLREAPAAAVAGALVESLGAARFVAVHFAAEVPPAGQATGGLVVVFGGRLLGELTVAPAAGGETIASPRRVTAVMPAPAASAAPAPGGGTADVLERARGLSVTLSADVAVRRVKLGELVDLAPGSAIDLGKPVTEPLELRVGSRRVASVDAVVLSGRLGVRVRRTGGA